MNARLLVMLIVTLFAAACGSSSSDATPTDSGPRLIEEATLPPPTVTPLRLFIATVTVESASGATRTPTPMQTRSGFFLETPTPPNTATPTVTDTPTRTPTLTPSRTATPTRTNTPAPTATFTPSHTPSITPLPSITPQNFVAAGSCPFEWFFSPVPSGCPLTNAVTSPAAFQQMQGGFMIWVQSGQTIFVLYESEGWLFAPDTYQEGEFLSNDGFLPPPGLLMPQRGFGKLWLNDAEVRTRLGWAVSPEVGYAATIQAETTTGTRYVSGPDGEVYLLENDGADWQRLR